MLVTSLSDSNSLSNDTLPRKYSLPIALSKVEKECHRLISHFDGMRGIVSKREDKPVLREATTLSENGKSGREPECTLQASPPSSLPVVTTMSEFFYSNPKEQQKDTKKIGDLLKSLCKSEAPNPVSLLAVEACTLEHFLFEHLLPILLDALLKATHENYPHHWIPFIEGFASFLQKFSSTHQQRCYQDSLVETLQATIQAKLFEFNFSFTLISLLVSFPFGQSLISDMALGLLTLHLDALQNLAQENQVSKSVQASLTILKSIVLLLVQCHTTLALQPEIHGLSHVLSTITCHLYDETRASCTFEVKKLVMVAKVHLDLIAHATNDGLASYVSSRFKAMHGTPKNVYFFAWMRAVFACTSTALPLDLAEQLIRATLAAPPAASKPTETALCLLRLDLIAFFCHRFTAVTQAPARASTVEQMDPDMATTIYESIWPSVLDTKAASTHLKAKAVISQLFQAAPTCHCAFLGRIVQLEPTHPARLPVLALALPWAGRGPLLVLDPRIFERVFGLLNHEGLAGRVLDFVVAWIQATPPNETAEEMFLSTCATCVVDSLTHSHAFTRKIMAGRLLKPMVTRVPLLAERVLRRLEGLRQVDHVPEDVLLEAFLALELAAHPKSANTSLLAQACVHPSVPLRLNALTQLRDRPALLRLFLETNANDPAPAFREFLRTRFLELRLAPTLLAWLVPWLFASLASRPMYTRACTLVVLLECVATKCPDTLEHFRILVDVFVGTPYDTLRAALQRVLRPRVCAPERVGLLATQVCTLLQSPKARDTEAAALLLDIVLDHAVLAYEALVPAECRNEAVNITPEEALAFLFQYYYRQAERQLDLAEAHRWQAATDAPLPSTFRAMAVGCRRLRLNPTAYFPIVKRAYFVVRECVSCASPEGFVPDDDDDLDAAHPSQWLLSFSWRVVKEMCAFLTGLLDQLDPANPDLLSFWSDVGSFLIQMMFELRHRGALLAVQPTLIHLCNLIGHTTSLPKLWIDDIVQKLNTVEILLTRRSGGAPFVMLSLLSPPGSRPHLASTLQTLFERSESAESPVVQVNNMNVLRRLFMDSTLNGCTSAYVECGFMLSVVKLREQDWSVQNAGLMLFSSLVHRVFGTTRACQDDYVIKQVTGKAFFERFPLLFNFLLEQMDTHAANSASAAFPLLALLSRLAPSTVHDQLSPYSLAKFLPFVMRCSASSIWKLRAMAATAAFPLAHLHENTVHPVSLLVENLIHTQKERNENKTHGLLLQLSVWVERSPQHGLAVHDWVALIQDHLHPGASHHSLAQAYHIFYLLLATSTALKEPFDITAWFKYHWVGFGSELARVTLLRPKGTATAHLVLHPSTLWRLLNDADLQVREAALTFGVQLHLVDPPLLEAYAAAWPLSPVSLQACLDVGHLPYAVDEMLKMARDPGVALSIRQALVTALGRFVAPVHQTAYASLLAEVAHPSAALPLREAALAGLRHFFEHTRSRALLWLAATTLLQDDDADLRHATATMLSTTVLRCPSPMHEHAVLLYLHEHARVFLDPAYLRATLRAHLVRATQREEEKKSEGRHLFDKEADNLYKDDVFECLLILRTLHLQDVNIPKLLKEIFSTLPPIKEAVPESNAHGVYETLYCLAYAEDHSEELELRISFFQAFYTSAEPLSLVQCFVQGDSEMSYP